MKRVLRGVLVVAASVAVSAGDDFGYHLADGSSMATTPQASSPGFGYEQTSSLTRDESPQASSSPKPSYAKDGGVYDAWLKSQKEKSGQGLRFQQMLAQEAEDSSESGSSGPAQAQSEQSEQTGATGATGTVDAMAAAEALVDKTLQHKVKAKNDIEDHKDKIKDAFNKIHVNAKEAHTAGPESDTVVDQLKKAKESIEEAKRLRAELNQKNKALEQATAAHAQAVKALNVLKGQRSNQASFAECEAKAAEHHKQCIALVKSGKPCPKLEPCGEKETMASGPAAAKPAAATGPVEVRERNEAPEAPTKPLSKRKKVLKELGERLLKMSLPLDERRTVSVLENKYLLAKKERLSMQAKVDKLQQDLELYRNKTMSQEDKDAAEAEKKMEAGPSGKMLAFVRGEINGLATDMGKLQKKVLHLAAKKTPGFIMPKKKKKKEDEDDTPKPPKPAGVDPNAAANPVDPAATDTSQVNSGAPNNKPAFPGAPNKQSPAGTPALGVKPRTVGNIHDPNIELNADVSPTVVPVVIDRPLEDAPDASLVGKSGASGAAGCPPNNGNIRGWGAVSGGWGREDGKNSKSPCGNAANPVESNAADASSTTADGAADEPQAVSGPPIDPTEPGQRSVADQVYEALGGDQVFRAAAAGEPLEQNPKTLKTSVGFGESPDVPAKSLQTGGLVSGQDESAESINEKLKLTAFLEQAKGLPAPKRNFDNMGPDEEMVARKEMYAETLHNKAELARLKWMEARQVYLVLEQQVGNAQNAERAAAKAVDLKIKDEQGNAAALINDEGKLASAKAALAAKPKDLTLTAIVQRLEAAKKARDSIRNHDEDDKRLDMKDEEQTLAALHARSNELGNQTLKVKQLQAAFGAWNVKAQQAAQDAAEARARFKISHDINDLVKREAVLSTSGKAERVRLHQQNQNTGPSTVQKEMMKIGTTFSDALNWRVGGSAGIPVPMHAPQTVTKEQMGAAVGAAIGAQRGAEIGAVKGAGDAALTMSNAGTSFLQTGAEKTFGEDMADKALAIARQEQEAAHRAFMGEDVAPTTWKERAAVADAKEDAEYEGLPRFRSLTHGMVGLGAHGLLASAVSSELSANKALRRAEVLRHHAQKLWQTTSAAKEIPSSLSSSTSAIEPGNDQATKNALFRGMPKIDSVQDPLFTETASWLKKQNLPTNVQAPPAFGSAVRFKALPPLDGLPRFQGVASLAGHSYSTDAMKLDLDAPLPDLN